jgi:hypothetical protein
MSLFRRHKKFEEQLKDQLGESEYKPSDSLWDRIDSGIPEDGFESGVQQSLENFEQVPYPETWEKIAAELPEERIGNRFLNYYGMALIALVLLTGIYIGFKLNIQPEQQIAQAENGEPVQQPATGISSQVQYPEQAQSISAASSHEQSLTGNETQTPATKSETSPSGTADRVVAADRPGTASTAAATQEQKRVQDTRTQAAQPRIVASESRKASRRSADQGIQDLPANTPVAVVPSQKHLKAAPSTQTSLPDITAGTQNTGIRSAGQQLATRTVIGKTSPPGIQEQPLQRRSSRRTASENGTAAGAVRSDNPVTETHTARPTTGIAAAATPDNHNQASRPAAQQEAVNQEPGSIAQTSKDPGSSNGQSNGSGLPGSVAAAQPSVPAATMQPEITPPAQGDVRVLSEAKPDSTSLPGYEEPSEYETLSPVSISIFTGLNMCFSTYSAPDNFTSSFEKNIALRKKLERPDIDWSGAFMLDIRLTPRWMISSGIMMTNFSQKFDYNTLPAVTPGNANEPGAALNNPNDSVTTGSTYSNRIKYTWTEIPLLISYSVASRPRFSFDLQGGISYAFINTIDAGIVANDNKGVLAVKSKEAFPQISNTVFATFLPQVAYRFNDQVSLGVVPSFKYSLSSIIGSERWVQQHPYFLGMSICLRKRF